MRHSRLRRRLLTSLPVMLLASAGTASPPSRTAFFYVPPHDAKGVLIGAVAPDGTTNRIRSCSASVYTKAGSLVGRRLWRESDIAQGSSNYFLVTLCPWPGTLRWHLACANDAGIAEADQTVDCASYGLLGPPPEGAILPPADEIPAPP